MDPPLVDSWVEDLNLSEKHEWQLFKIVLLVFPCIGK